jgi:peroxiredoxin
MLRTNTMYCLIALMISVSGCAWETGGTDKDAGDQDGNNTNYPPPPYGTDYGDTIENFRLDEVLCGTGGANSRAIYAANFLDAKATLITVHAGWCSVCKSQATTMEAGLYQKYKDQGFRILLVMFEDEDGGSEKQALMDYTCTYRDRYNMTFTLAVDPGAAVMGQFFRPTQAGTPLNMLIDNNMVIRYKVEGVIPDVLEGNIEAVLSEQD